MAGEVLVGLPSSEECGAVGQVSSEAGQHCVFGDFKNQAGQEPPQHKENQSCLDV